MIVTSASETYLYQVYWMPEITQTPEQEEFALPEDEVEESAEETSEKLRGENGVLRLLAEDHFKPNAEMRLREIFHTELAILGLLDTDAQTPEETTPAKTNNGAGPKK